MALLPVICLSCRPVSCGVMQEDAIVVNLASVQRGLFCSTTFGTHKFKEVSSGRSIALRALPLLRHGPCKIPSVALPLLGHARSRPWPFPCWAKGT